METLYNVASIFFPPPPAFNFLASLINGNEGCIFQEAFVPLFLLTS